MFTDLEESGRRDQGPRVSVISNILTNEIKYVIHYHIDKSLEEAYVKGSSAVFR